MNNSTTEFQWCQTSLDKFHTEYHNLHGYVSLFVCIFGCIANTLNIAVLTRRDMRSPTNAILTGLAIADLLVMLDYIPFTINEYLYKQFDFTRTEQRSYGWAVTIYFHAFFSQTGHTISIFLTVTLAVWRYIAIAHPQRNRAWCNMRNTVGAIVSSYVICPLLCVFTFFIIKIVPKVELHTSDGEKMPKNASEDMYEGAQNVTLYFVDFTDYIHQYLWIWPTYFWSFSVIIKIIPSIALTVLSLRLVGALLEAKRRRKQLMGHSNGMRPIISKEIQNGHDEKKGNKKKSRVMDKERQTDRTTRMLLAVLLLFLITEIPQGVLGLVSASSKPFYSLCYLKLGETMDILALINSAINFILYCTMSRQFRTTFKLLFWPKFLNRWLPVSQDEMNECEMREANGHTTTVTQV